MLRDRDSHCGSPPGEGPKPLFARAALLLATMLACLCVLLTSWFVSDRQAVTTLPLLAVLTTLSILLIVGEFVRQRFRLSLRTMLVGVSVMAIGLGCFGATWNQSRLQRAGITSIERLRSRALPPRPVPWSPMPIKAEVSVTYAQEAEEERDFFQTRKGHLVPSWLIDVLGQDFFFDADCASFQRIDLSSSGVLQEVELSCVPRLTFNECRFSRESIQTIGAVQALRELTFFDCVLTTTDFEQLAKLPRLEVLSLFRVDVSPEALRHISASSFVKNLDIQEAGLKSGQLSTLALLQNLEALNLSGNMGLTMDDLQVLKRLPKLSGVNLTSTGITEAAIPLLESLPKLRWASVTASSPEVGEQLKQAIADRDQGPMIYIE